jgi:hypothetical protein
MMPKWGRLIFLLPIIICITYLSGYITQFIANYQLWQKDGHFAGDGSSPSLPSMEPSACYQALTHFPYNLYGLGICIIAFAILIIFVMKLGHNRNGGISDKERNLTYSNKGTYGTSEFMNNTEMHQVLKLVGNIKIRKGLFSENLGIRQFAFLKTRG